MPPDASYRAQHWLVTHPGSRGAIGPFVALEADLDDYRRQGWKVEGPFVPDVQHASVEEWMRRVREVVDEAHRENLGGKHRDGGCEACADAYLVAQRAGPGAPS